MEAIFENYPQSESDESSSDSFEEVDAEKETPAAPSETRMVREMGEGSRALQSSRPAPTRHETPLKPANPIINPSADSRGVLSAPIA